VPPRQLRARLPGWEPGVTDQPYSLGGNYFSFACADMNDDGFNGSHERHDPARRRRQRRGPSELILNPGRAAAPSRDPATRTTASSSRATVPGPTGTRRRQHGPGRRRPRRQKDIFATTTGAYEVSDTHRLWRQTSSGPRRSSRRSSTRRGSSATAICRTCKAPLHRHRRRRRPRPRRRRDELAADAPRLQEPRRSGPELVRVRLVGGGKGAANTSAIGAT